LDKQQSSRILEEVKSRMHVHSVNNRQTITD